MELVGKAEVAKLLSVCERTLENLVRRGEFPPPVTVGKRVYWTRAVVDGWLQSTFAAQVAWVPRRRSRGPRPA